MGGRVRERGLGSRAMGSITLARSYRNRGGSMPLRPQWERRLGKGYAGALLALHMPGRVQAETPNGSSVDRRGDPGVS